MGTKKIECIVAFLLKEKSGEEYECTLPAEYFVDNKEILINEKHNAYKDDWISNFIAFLRFENKEFMFDLKIKKEAEDFRFNVCPNKSFDELNSILQQKMFAEELEHINKKTKVKI